LSFSYQTSIDERLVAVDTCVLVDLHQGKLSSQTEYAEKKIKNNTIFVPPIVITEYLSNPRLDKKYYKFFKDVPALEIKEGYWQRAGDIRSTLLKKGLKAKLGDALIAQACIDNEVPLLTSDEDFRHYEKHCGLILAVKSN
jgi:hypothetical protein